MKQALKFLRRMAAAPRVYGREEGSRFRALLKLVEKGVLVPVAQSHRDIERGGLVLRDGTWTLAISPSGLVEGYYKNRPAGLYHWVQGHLCGPDTDCIDGSTVFYPVDSRVGRLVVEDHRPPEVE